LVVAQFAIAVALVAVATALGNELQRSLAADQGFERDRVMTALFDAESSGYNPKTIFSLLERMRTSALGVPGVKAVSFSSSGILAGSQSTSAIYIRDPQARTQQGQFQHDSILPGYLGVVGVPVLIGRDFSESDKAGALPVAIVSTTFARAVFGDRNPVGQSFGFDAQPSNRDWTIVGIVADVRANGVREEPPPMFYLSVTQWADEGPHFMAIRFEGSEAAVQQNLRAALARTEPGLVLTSWKTLKQRMTDDLRGDLATTRLAEIFGACAILLAGAGVAGSLGYLVVLRQRELALRMAIGATPGRMLRSVLADSLRLSALGGAIGMVVVWLGPMLPTLKTVLHSPPSFESALTATVIALVSAMIAGWIPALRAARIDPIIMLKGE
jgi:ABC-type antimicrobial peptide transport system permease subunit